MTSSHPRILASSHPRILASSHPRRRALHLASLIAAGLLLSSAASAQVNPDWFVDANLTTGNQDGKTWANAMPHPSDALQASSVDDVIFVAVGTYDANLGIGRAQTITVPNGVSLYGGFNPGDMLLPGAGRYRETVLSGDINVGGVPTADAYNVVTVQSGTSLTIINGFLISGGLADGPPTLFGFQGGGIQCVGSDLELRNCIVSENFAFQGGGLFFQGTGTEGNSLQCYRTTFINNRALNQGGGAWVEDVKQVSSTEPSWMFNCRFARNLAGPTTGNIGTAGGGGLYLGARIPGPGTSPAFLVMNGLFTDNLVRGNGAALFLFEDGVGDTALLKDNVHILFSTFAFNVVIQSDDPITGGGTIYVSAMEPNNDPAALSSFTSFLVGSVVWNNSSPVSSVPVAGPGATTSGSMFDSQRLQVAVSDVMYPGVYPAPPFTSLVDNINADPTFVNGASRDLRLQSGSPCIEGVVGSIMAVPLDFPDMNDMFGSTDPTPYEFFGPRLRLVGPIADMGCHEHQGTTP